MNKKYIFRLLIFFSIYLIFNILIFYYFYEDKESRIKIFFDQKVEKLISEYKATKNSFKMISGFVSEYLNKRDDILKLIYKIKISNNKEKNFYRKKLINELAIFYNILKNNKIYYLTLFFPNGEILLRMHQPYKFGDYLYKEDKLNIFLKNTFDSSEIGIIYNYPIFYRGKLLANIKTLISYDVLKQELSKLFNSSYEFILKREFISDQMLKVGQKLFIQSDINKEYFYEESSISRDRSRVNNKTIHQINLILQKRIENRLNLEENFAEAVKLDKKYYIITFIKISPLQNSNKSIGYLISYEDDNTYEIFDSVFWHNIILGNIIIILLLLFLFYILGINEKLKHIASIDKLTKLYNRNKFYEIAQNEIERAKRYKRALSLIIFDIDHFKRINDTYGHNIGDYVLLELSNLIKKNIRKNDIAFRWGGEEFIVLAPETDIDGASKLAEKLREAVENFNFDKVGKVTISLGVAEYNENKDKDIDSLINRADEALYISKESGRNRVTILD